MIAFFLAFGVLVALSAAVTHTYVKTRRHIENMRAVDSLRKERHP